MGLFRSRAKKNREKAAALREQPTSVTVPETAALAEQPTSTTVQETAAVPEQPTSVAVPAAVSAHRETTAESRPDPDRPGWGRTIGQQIGKAHGNRPGQD